MEANKNALAGDGSPTLTDLSAESAVSGPRDYALGPSLPVLWLRPQLHSTAIREVVFPL